MIVLKNMKDLKYIYTIKEWYFFGYMLIVK